MCGGRIPHFNQGPPLSKDGHLALSLRCSGCESQQETRCSCNHDYPLETSQCTRTHHTHSLPPGEPDIAHSIQQVQMSEKGSNYPRESGLWVEPSPLAAQRSWPPRGAPRSRASAGIRFRPERYARSRHARDRFMTATTL